MKVARMEWEATEARKQLEVDEKLLQLGVFVDGVTSSSVKQITPGVVEGGKVAEVRELSVVKREKRGHSDTDSDEEIEILEVVLPPKTAGKLHSFFFSSFFFILQNFFSAFSTFSFHLVPGSGEGSSRVPPERKRARASMDDCHESAGRVALLPSPEASLPAPSSLSLGVKLEPVVQLETSPEQEKNTEGCCIKVDKKNLSRHKGEVHEMVRRNREAERRDRSHYEQCSLCRIRYADMARHVRTKHPPQLSTSPTLDKSPSGEVLLESLQKISPEAMAGVKGAPDIGGSDISPGTYKRYGRTETQEGCEEGAKKDTEGAVGKKSRGGFEVEATKTKRDDEEGDNGGVEKVAKSPANKGDKEDPEVEVEEAVYGGARKKAKRGSKGGTGEAEKEVEGDFETKGASVAKTKGTLSKVEVKKAVTGGSKKEAKRGSQGGTGEAEKEVEGDLESKGASVAKTKETLSKVEVKKAVTGGSKKEAKRGSQGGTGEAEKEVEGDLESKGASVAKTKETLSKVSKVLVPPTGANGEAGKGFEGEIKSKVISAAKTKRASTKAFGTLDTVPVLWKMSGRLPEGWLWRCNFSLSRYK